MSQNFIDFSPKNVFFCLFLNSDQHFLPIKYMHCFFLFFFIKRLSNIWFWFWRNCWKIFYFIWLFFVINLQWHILKKMLKKTKLPFFGAKKSNVHPQVYWFLFFVQIYNDHFDVLFFCFFVIFPPKKHSILLCIFFSGQQFFAMSTEIHHLNKTPISDKLTF